MTKTGIIFFFVIISSGVTAQAQDSFTLDGHLKDVKAQPVPFANVSLSDSSNQIIAGVASDINGDFEISGIKEGLYNINIQFVGYETWSRMGVLINRDIHIGTLTFNGVITGAERDRCSRRGYGKAL